MSFMKFLYFNLLTFNVLFIADLPKVPVIDLGFLVSTSGADANENFRKIKGVIKEFVDKYGKERLRYSVILSGDKPSVKWRFSDIFPTDDSLKRFVDALPIPTSAGFLDKGLEEARKLFQLESRPDAEKILVVIADKRSGSDAVKTPKAAQQLDDDNVVIISVALHDGDTSELKNITAQVRNFIKGNKTLSTEDLAVIIMDKVVQGNFISAE